MNECPLNFFRNDVINGIPVTKEEIQLKESIQKMLQGSIFEFSEIKVWQEVSLDFPEPFKDCEIAAIDKDDKDYNWSEESYFGVCSQSDRNVDLDCKRRAVEF